jgi:hypothetical protein
VQDESMFQKQKMQGNKHSILMRSQRCLLNSSLFCEEKKSKGKPPEKIIPTSKKKNNDLAKDKILQIATGSGGRIVVFRKRLESDYGVIFEYVSLLGIIYSIPF